MRLSHCLLALALLCPAALAWSQPDANGERLDQLIVRAGLDRQLGELQGAMQQGISRTRRTRR